MEPEALLTLTAFVDGRNAKVSIFPDRVEWNRKAILGSGGGHEMTPVSKISSVVVAKDGLVWRKLQFVASGNVLEFKAAKKEAEDARALVARLMLETPAPAPVVDVADQLAKLAELHAQGILTGDEFAAQKAKLLG